MLNHNILRKLLLLNQHKELPLWFQNTTYCKIKCTWLYNKIEVQSFLFCFVFCFLFFVPMEQYRCLNAYCVIKLSCPNFNQFMCFFQPDRGTDSRMPCMEPWFTSLVFDPTSWLCSFMWRCIPALPNRICAHHSKLTSFTNYPPSCSKDMWRRRSCKERWITTPFLFSIYVCLS